MMYLNAQHILANIEIKPCRGREVETGRVVAALANQLAVGERPPLVSSFNIDALAAAAEGAPKLPRALLVERYDRSVLDVARDLGCVSVNCPWQDVNRSMLSQLHAEGLRVMAFTINDTAVAKTLLALGLDGLFTDALDDMAGTFPTLLRG